MGEGYPDITSRTQLKYLLLRHFNYNSVMGLRVAGVSCRHLK